MKSRVVLTAACLAAAVLPMLPIGGSAQTIGGVAPDLIDSGSANPGAAGTAGLSIGIGIGVGSVLTTSGLELDVPILGFDSTTMGSAIVRIGDGGTTISIRSGMTTVGPGGTSTSSLTGPSSLLGPLDLGASPPFTSFGRFLPGVGPNASGIRRSPRLPTPALDSTTSTLGAPSSLRGPLNLGTNPPFTSFGRFLPGVAPNASGTRPSPRLRTPGAAPSAARSSGGGFVWDSFCDPQDFTCDQ